MNNHFCRLPALALDEMVWMELEEVLGKRPGSPPSYEVIFRVVAAGRIDPNELSGSRRM